MTNELWSQLYGLQLQDMNVPWILGYSCHTFNFLPCVPGRYSNYHETNTKTVKNHNEYVIFYNHQMSNDIVSKQYFLY